MHYMEHSQLPFTYDIEPPFVHQTVKISFEITFISYFTDVIADSDHIDMEVLALILDIERSIWADDQKITAFDGILIELDLECGLSSHAYYSQS